MAEKSIVASLQNSEKENAGEDVSMATPPGEQDEPGSLPKDFLLKKRRAANAGKSKDQRV